MTPQQIVDECMPTGLPLDDDWPDVRDQIAERLVTECGISENIACDLADQLMMVQS